jgi:hypothetical protein
MGKTVRRFARDITSCMFCPSVTTDQNGTRWQCGKTRTFICWMGTDEEEKNAPIPKDCPLPIKEVTHAI